MIEHATANPEYMRAAIEAARESVRHGAGGPFGACIVRDGEVLAVASNQVLIAHDPTAHAEVVAIREACAHVGTHLLEGAEIYATTEPCPLCFSAIHWARIERIISGTRIADAAQLGFNEMPISNRQMGEWGQSPVQVQGDFLRDECLELFDFWQSLENRRTY
jgi:tRNA(Arg) A34 adenosine deaminase TadA